MKNQLHISKPSILLLLLLLNTSFCFSQRDSLSYNEFNKTLTKKANLNFEEIKTDTLELIELVKLNNSLCSNMIFTEERIAFEVFLDWKEEEYILEKLEFHLGPRKTLYSLKYDMFYDCGLVENDKSSYLIYDAPKLSEIELKEKFEWCMSEFEKRRKNKK